MCLSFATLWLQIPRSTVSGIANDLKEESSLGSSLLLFLSSDFALLYEHHTKIDRLAFEVQVVWWFLNLSVVDSHLLYINMRWAFIFFKNKPFNIFELLKILGTFDLIKKEYICVSSFFGYAFFDCSYKKTTFVVRRFRDLRLVGSPTLRKKRAH